MAIAEITTVMGCGQARRLTARRALPAGRSVARGPRVAGGKDLPRALRVELPRGIDEVARVDDVIAVEHLPRLPADELHHDALRNAGADEVSDGRPAKVVEHAARHPGGAACRRPRLVEAPDRVAVRAGEDICDRASQLAFALARDRPAAFQERAELGREREHTALAGLRGAGVEPDLADVEGDVRPAEPGGFGPPAPARRVEERHEVGEVRRQPRERPRDARARRGPAVALFQIRFGHRYIAPPAESHVEPPARR